MCKIHEKQNIKVKCSNLQISNAVSKVIVSDIFGSKDLVHASTETEYWKKLEELKQKWDRLEREDTRREPRFSSFFSSYKADEILHHVTAKVSKEAGFDNEVQCNNVSESGNAVMKRWQNFEAKDMCTFLDDVRKLTDKQRSDVQRAFLGLHSPYIAREEYRDRVKVTEILDATPEERRRILNSVKVIVDPTRYKQVLSYCTTPMLPCFLFKAEKESEEDLPSMLETTTTTVTGTHDGFATPRDIVAVAEPAQGSQDACSTVGCLKNLLNTFTRKDINALGQRADNLQTDIRQGFDGDTFFVKSTFTSKPHIVQRVLGSRDGYSCDKECLGFVSRKICAHIVAIANFRHNLLQFVSWIKKSS